MFSFYETHKIKPVVAKEYPFGEAKAAFKFLEDEGDLFGKVVIKVD